MRVAYLGRLRTQSFFALLRWHRLQGDGASICNNFGPLNGGPLSLQGVRLPSLAWRSAGAHLRLSKNVRALFFLGRTGGEAHGTGFTARFRHPDEYRPRKRYVWGTRQSRWLSTADGFAVSAGRSIQDQQNQTLNQHDCSHPRAVATPRATISGAERGVP